jgi:hypothetical protein
MSDKKTPSCGMHEALISYLYDETTSDEARRFENHLQQCSGCREEMAAFKRVRDMLQSWELDDVPIVRVTPPAPRRSALDVLKELLGITPVWAKGLGAVAAGLIVLSVIGTSVSIGRDGFKFDTSIFGKSSDTRVVSVVDKTTDKPGITRAEVAAMVNQMVLESEKKLSLEIRSDLQKSEKSLQNSHSSDFARIAARVQEQRERIRTLERDIDRREGLTLTDLFSRLSDDPKKDAESPQADGEGGR